MSDWLNRVFQHSSEDMSEIPDASVDCCVTSPPYWALRDYGHEGQIGQEPSPEAFIARLISVFAEVRRVLRDDGTLWVNIGDTYSTKPRGTDDLSTSKTLVGRDLSGWLQSGRIDKTKASGVKEKDLIGIPWMLAFALRADGWYLRSDIIWSKTSCMPESITDRPSKSHEYVFLLSKSKRYYYDADAIREPLAESSVERLAQDVDSQEGSSRANAGGKTNGNMKAVGDLKGANKRTVWSIAPAGYPGAHFATFPPELAKTCIMAGSRSNGIVLDPFMGSGTTAQVALNCGRRFVGYELNPEYHKLIQDRLGLFGAA